MDRVLNLAKFWSRWGLLQRIAAVQSLLLLGGAALMTVLLIQQHRTALVHDQQARARLLTLVVTPLVAEQAVVEDYAAIKQLLERQATVYVDTSRLVWSRDGREEVSVAVNSTAARPPAWFRTLIDIPVLQHSAPVELGGTDYGGLQVTLEAGPIESRLWDDSVYYLSMSVGAAIVILLALLFVLRGNLRVLRNLAAAADRFSQGDHNVRIDPHGAREVSNAAVAFNNMTERIRGLLDELSDSRHRLREQLHFSEELIETLPLPMYYKSPKGVYLSVNKAWEAFFGVGRSEMIGKKVRTLFEHAPATADFHEQMDQELLRSGGVQTYEIPIRTRDGRERQAMYAKSLLTNSQGQVTSLIGIITDLTELKQAQEQAQQALVAKAAAEQANKSKSMFLANMSHEIRTPLTAIIGFSEALLDINQSMSERIEGILTINRAGKHLLGIINDILDLSKIEAGRLEVEQMPVSLFGLVEEVAALARLQAETKGIQFEVEHVYPLPETVRSDPVRAKQILLNIISNAIKFTEQGWVRLTVRHDEVSARLELEVIDTGIGISPEQLARLFQPFSQADASTTRRFGGTGLGLALSKQLAEKLGGGITVESVPGEGSRFTITLDAGPTGTLIHNAEEARRLRHRMAEEETVVALRGSLLVAEDNPDNQRLIALNTRRLGLEIKLADNGQLAVEAALAQPYDLILMDMQMPVMDGLTAVRTLRDRGYTGPIVALTANASQQDMDNCLAAGCDGFLSKPIERQKFGEVLQRYLARGEVQDQEEQDLEANDPVPLIPELLQKDPALLELMNTFHSRALDHHKDLQQALAAGDREVIKLQARKLKTSGSDYMCPQITDLASQLEFAAASGNARAVRKLVDKIGKLIERMQLAVEQNAESRVEPVDDTPLVSRLLEEGPEMADLVEYFLSRLPGYETDLKVALAAGDAIALKKKAHDLKSVGGGYGYPQVTELAIELEGRAAAGDLKQAAELVDQFSRLARRIEAGAVTAPTAQAAVG